MKELRHISRYVLFLQIGNAKYDWPIEELEFYNENNIKIIDWPPYSPDLNPIENIWAIMKRKIAGKTFTTINSLKNEVYNMERTWWWDDYEDMNEQLWQNDCIEATTTKNLTNYFLYIHFINII